MANFVDGTSEVPVVPVYGALGICETIPCPPCPPCPPAPPPIGEGQLVPPRQNTQ